MNASVVPASFHPRFAVPVQERVHVHAGAIYATRTPALITTVVSSSVAVCIWSPAAAGVAHFVLPVRGSGQSLHYGYQALMVLRDRLRAAGAEDHECVASVFGGAEAASGLLGRRNVLVARDFLRRCDIPIVREETGGHAARRITFATADGSAVTRALLQ